MSTVSRSRMSAEDRHAHFLEAARTLLREQGLEALTMERLAAACGVTKALPYRFFRNRDDVLVQLVDAGNAEFDVHLAEAMRGQSTFDDKIATLIRVWYEWIESGNDIPALQQARTADGELEARIAARNLVGVHYIADIILAHFRLDRRDALLAASVLGSSRHGFSSMLDVAGDHRRELLDAYVAMSVGAVRALAARATGQRASRARR
jgi:AcrR family transcriptional regulator